jgi:hypothetical protein
MAIYRGPIRRMLQRPSPHSRFAGLLAKPGFNPRDVRAEVACHVEHGVPGTEPECAGKGALALLVGRELGWVAPVAADRRSRDSAIALPDRLDGSIKAGWVTGWTLSAGELTVHYVSPAGPDGGRWMLLARGEPAALAGFVARSARVLTEARRR